MNDETQQATESAPENTSANTEAAPAEPTLEDVYKSAGVDAEPQQQRQAPQQQAPQWQQPSAPVVPDPYDTEAHKAYLANLAATQANTVQGLAAVSQMITQQYQHAAQQKIQADIKQAVETISEVTGNVKPKVLEAMLDAEAREDPRFKRLWEQREQKPEAWKNALKAVGKKIAGDFDMKTDPNLAAAQRARKTSQSAMATTSADSKDSSWEGLSGTDFASKWNQMMTGGNG